MAEEVKDYSLDLQKLFVQFMITDPELYSRVRAIVEPKYFDRNIRKVVEVLVNHSEEYATIPTTEIIKAQTGQEIEKLDNINQHVDWFIDEFETFCRHKAIEKAIIDSADLLETGKYGEVELRIKEAVQTGLARSLGTDYFADPRARLEKLSFSTFFRDFDFCLELYLGSGCLEASGGPVSDRKSVDSRAELQKTKIESKKPNFGKMSPIFW